MFPLENLTFRKVMIAVATLVCTNHREEYIEGSKNKSISLNAYDNT
jgi:hypothetical protein